jgi:hypothetical protein
MTPDKGIDIHQCCWRCDEDKVCLWLYRAVGGGMFLAGLICEMKLGRFHAIPFYLIGLGMMNNIGARSSEIIRPTKI